MSLLRSSGLYFILATINITLLAERWRYERSQISNFATLETTP
jgi:hypothetical protein